MKKQSLAAIAFLNLIATPVLLQAQEADIKAFDQKYINWYNADVKEDKKLGTSVTKTYRELLAGKTPKKTVVVAVIDGGVDIYHEDLKGKIWVNSKEIPGNNIDDDNNGYVDDVYGWNFIGNSKGENIIFENLEYTRIYRAGLKEESYTQASKVYEKELAQRKKNLNNIIKFEEKYKSSLKVVNEYFEINVTGKKDLEKLTSEDADVQAAITFLKQRYAEGFTEAGLARAKSRNEEFIDKYLNVEYDARKVIGDNPFDITDTRYGNPDVKGPRATHGTCVAGIIAANRSNGIGIDGIATDVKIMAIRITPDGDERDKDVALAIRYAVENGADIINMSFGKAFSPQKNFVDDAVKFAESRNVLLIHASGNDGNNIDIEPNFPDGYYADKTEATNYLEIGASAMNKGKFAPAIFSNYGKKNVDIFAPGVDIVSLDTNNTYNKSNGTSFAAPVVAGIAALMLSYYPDLTPKQIIDIILASGNNIGKQKVLQPGLTGAERKKVRFNTLSKTGAVINAYNAMKMAENYNRKAKL